MPQATASTETILTAARLLLTAAVPTIEQRGLTLLGFAIANLDDADAVQLALPFACPASDALDTVLDEVRDRFGAAAITRAVLIGRGDGLTVPLLPD
jgi:DNA polymerase-4